MDEKAKTAEEAMAKLDEVLLSEEEVQEVSEKLEKDFQETNFEDIPEAQPENMSLKDYQDIEVLETLVFQLNEKELADVAVEAADFSRELKGIELEFANVKKDYTQKIKDYKARIDALMIKTKEGEQRNIKCTKRFIYDEEEVQFILDGIVLKQRKMLEEEKQKQLFTDIPEDSFVSSEDAKDAGCAESKSADLDEVQQPSMDLVENTSCDDEDY